MKYTYEISEVISDYFHLRQIGLMGIFIGLLIISLSWRKFRKSLATGRATSAGPGSVKIFYRENDADNFYIALLSPFYTAFLGSIATLAGVFFFIRSFI